MKNTSGAGLILIVITLVYNGYVYLGNTENEHTKDAWNEMVNASNSFRETQLKAEVKPLDEMDLDEISTFTGIRISAARKCIKSLDKIDVDSIHEDVVKLIALNKDYLESEVECMHELESYFIGLSAETGAEEASSDSLDSAVEERDTKMALYEKFLADTQMKLEWDEDFKFN